MSECEIPRIRVLVADSKKGMQHHIANLDEFMDALTNSKIPCPDLPPTVITDLVYVSIFLFERYNLSGEFVDKYLAKKARGE